jgi:hypothetical protein
MKRWKQHATLVVAGEKHAACIMKKQQFFNTVICSAETSQ